MKVKNSFAAPVLVLTLYILLTVSSFIDMQALEYKGSVYLSAIILQLMIFVLPGIFYCKLKGHGYTLRLNLGLFSPGKIVFVLLAFAVLLTGTVLIRIFLYNIGAFSGKEATVTAYSGGGTGVADILYILLAFAVIPALTEEFIFRSILLTEYTEGGNGAVCAAVMTSLMFAMLHFSIAELPIYFYAGIILAITVYVTRSVLCSVIVHMLNNIVSLLFEGVIARQITHPDNMTLFVFVLFALLLIFLFFFFGEAERLSYVYGMKGKSAPPYAGTVSGGGKFIEAIISPTFLICVLFFIIVILAKN